MGKIHRYYTKEDMKLLECAGKLLEAGISLEEIKGILPEILQVKEKKIKVKGGVIAETTDEIQEKFSEQDSEQDSKGVELDPEISNDIVSALDQLLINNNQRLEEGVTQMVTESVKKEMSYLLLAKDQVEEERYKRLDTLIRQQQVFRKECGKRSMGGFVKDVLGFTG